MSQFLNQVIVHTPPWVWLILAALIALGTMQARDHVVTRRRLWIGPIALGGYSLVGASMTFGLHASVQPTWLSGLLAGLMLGTAFGWPRRLRANSGDRVEVAGSWAPLGLYLVIFALRYAIAASLAVSPQLRGLDLFMAAASLLYGLPAGLLAARALRMRTAMRSGACACEAIPDNPGRTSALSAT